MRDCGEFGANIFINASDEFRVDGHEDWFEPLMKSNTLLVDELLIDSVDGGVAEVVVAEPGVDEEVRVVAHDSVLGPSLVQPAEFDDQVDRNAEQETEEPLDYRSPPREHCLKLK